METRASIASADIIEAAELSGNRLPPKHSNVPAPVPVSFVPTPTQGFREHRKLLKALVEPGLPQHGTVGAALRPIPIPIPIPIPPLPRPPGSRMLIWKQDPSVNE